MAANTEYTKIKESTISAFFSKLKAFFWPKADVVNIDVIDIDLADVALTGDYDDLDNTPEVDSTPTENSTNLVTSGGVASALSGKEVTNNKVTSLSVSSTDTQYPSAKCVYDLVGDVETLINAL